VRIEATLHQSREIEHFISLLKGPAIRNAGAMGLNEHAKEQGRLSVTHIASYANVPASRIRSKMTIRRASAAGAMEAAVRVSDAAITLAEYGNPVWKRDLSPGWGGGPVSSMLGAEATGWERRRMFKHAFIANGQVVVRRSAVRDAPLKTLYGAVLANELAKPSHSNPKRAERYLAFDLEKRVTRHILRALGT